MDNALVLDLVTINTGKCDGNYPQRVDGLKKGLRALKPSVVASQEVFQSEAAGADTGRDLADFLGMHRCFTPARPKDRLLGGRLVPSYSGLAVLSVHPIVRSWTIPLPTDERDGERIAQCCLLDCVFTRVLVINTHLSHLRGASSLRRQQLETILAHALPDGGETYGAVYLGGDFNAEKQSEEMRYLVNHAKFSVINGYRAGNGEPPGFTVPAKPGESSAGSRGRCIDYIFSVTKKGERHPTITHASVVLDAPDERGNYPSDHFGVLVSAQIAPSRGKQ
ncbi:MAG: hypothetical protein H7Z75_10885 [Ferruginibacter sp.]|nr:hypothetical protein [Cytophagales bacterium]